MTKPAALLALLCVLAACSSDPKEEPQTTGDTRIESAPAEPSTALPAAETPPADSNTTMPAATPEEAAPPPEP